MQDNKIDGNKKLRVISYGLGPVGLAAARIVLDNNRLEIVGAIDIAEEKVSKDLGDLLTLDRKVGIRVSSNWRKVSNDSHADVVLHATGSRLEKVYSQIEDIVSAGINCVSSCEELFFPYTRHPDLSWKIDKVAREHQVTVLGTGVNPGFVMDALPLFLTGACKCVKGISVERVVDVSTRRFPLQKKVGAGLRPKEFENMVKEGMLGHVGLIETAQFLAHNLGWELDKFQEAIKPVIAQEPVSTQFFDVQKGYVVGINHTVYGVKNGERIIALTLKMYIGARDSRDVIHIEGDPALEVLIKKGVPGDIATAAILVNTVPLVAQARPGLLTVKDMMLLHNMRGHEER